MFLVLFTQTEFCDQFPVSVKIDSRKVAKETATLADHLQQPAPGMVILFMNFQVFGEIGYLSREQRNLDPGVTGVFFVFSKLRNDCALFFYA